MEIVESKDKIINKVYEICKKKGIEVWHDLSNTSESVYFWIKMGEVKSKFRISDHACSVNHYTKGVIIGKSTKQLNIERFVENRIKSLKNLCLKVAFQKLMCSASQNTVVAYA